MMDGHGARAADRSSSEGVNSSSARPWSAIHSVRPDVVPKSSPLFSVNRVEEGLHDREISRCPRAAYRFLFLTHKSNH